MIKLYTKPKAYDGSSKIIPLIQLNENVDSKLSKQLADSFVIVEDVNDCDCVVFPYIIQDYTDPILSAFVHMTAQTQKPMLCFTNSHDNEDCKKRSTKNLLFLSELDYSLFGFNESLSVYLRNIMIKLKVLVSNEEIIERLNWNIINVYKSHIRGKKNHFINDYNIDAYNFFKTTLAKHCGCLLLTNELKNDKETPNICFSSVYGIQRPNKNQINILYTAESKSRYIYYSNIERVLNDFDYYIGFDVPINDSMFRLPYWLTMFDFSHESEYMKLLRNDRTGLNDKKHLNIAMIATTDFNLLRSSFVTRCFENNCEVHCPSKVCKNTHSMPVGREGEGDEHFFKGKLDYLRDFKIEICFENTHQHGYITEKLFGSLMTGTIPVYWGTEFTELIEDKIINSERIIRLEKDLSNFEEAIGKVRKLLTDKDYYEAFYKLPIFKPNADKVVELYLNKYDKFMKNIVNQITREKSIQFTPGELNHN